jgi:VWFA-related protein
VIALLLALGLAQQPPVFQAKSEVVAVDVHVGRAGLPVQGLTAADFEVRDRGRRQVVELAQQGIEALHVVLACDRSESMRGAPLDHIKAALRGFLGGLAAEDRATLLAFDYRLSVAARAAPPAAALGAVDTLQARGPTALRDALYAALELTRSAAGRRVVLVFTDGTDTLSYLGETELLRVARESDVSVYAVRGGSGEQGLLERVGGETGGRVLEARAGPRLTAAFAEILSELKNRYVLRFVPEDQRPGWHPLEVRLRPGLKGEVRARRGYRR